MLSLLNDIEGTTDSWACYEHATDRYKADIVGQFTLLCFLKVNHCQDICQADTQLKHGHWKYKTEQDVEHIGGVTRYLARRNNIVSLYHHA